MFQAVQFNRFLCLCLEKKCFYSGINKLITTAMNVSNIYLKADSITSENDVLSHNTSLYDNTGQQSNLLKIKQHQHILCQRLHQRRANGDPSIKSVGLCLLFIQQYLTLFLLKYSLKQREKHNHRKQAAG